MFVPYLYVDLYKVEIQIRCFYTALRRDLLTVLLLRTDEDSGTRAACSLNTQ